MGSSVISRGDRDRVIVVGAGIAGLAAAARLARAGREVLVLERQATPGGKMRALPTAAGPADAGPTVLTMRGVFEALFADLGARLEDHVTLIRQHRLARHFWPDGSTLDLFDDREANAAAIRGFAGGRAETQFRAFDTEARRLFDAFDRPVMQSHAPRMSGIVRAVARAPDLLRHVLPRATLGRLLGRGFDDPRLRQLFGRYATYVGGQPDASPALLALVWHAEASGVWAVEGGLHRLALALAGLAEARGATIRCDTEVARIETRRGRATGVVLTDGAHLPAGAVLFNGDPRALATGLLGPGASRAGRATRRAPRSLSAEVWAFAARAEGPELAHHNIFFRDDPAPEFAALARSILDPTPTLYVCAQDRAGPAPPPPVERFEIIANAPPLGRRPEAGDETCATRTFGTLARHGLRFDPTPDSRALTTPADFETLFPASAGALYGQSPHGLLAVFRRPTARSPVRGLYLCGGGTHPGAGVPMATLSARHAAEAILNDRTSTSRSRRTATRGGTSTGSATGASGGSRSSPS